MAFNLLYFYMKVAVALYQNVIAPRVDIADRVAIYDIENAEVKGKETYNLAYNILEQLVYLMDKKKIGSLICGGCPQFFLRTLEFYGSRVYYGQIGNPDAVVKMWITGKLPLPYQAIPFRGRRRRRGRYHR